MYATIDQLVDRLDVQIRKHKERQVDHKAPIEESARKILRPAPPKEEAGEKLRWFVQPGGAHIEGGNASAGSFAWFVDGVHRTILWEIADSSASRSRSSRSH